MRKQILLLIVLCLHMAARGQTIEGIDLTGLPQPTQAKALRYWFDDDASSVQTVSKLSGQHVLDVSGLIEGLHTLHYQVIDTEGDVAYVSSSVFLKMGASSGVLTVKSMRYWFDDDAASVKTVSSGGVQTLDVSALHDGLHTIHYQVTGSDGQDYYVASRLFLKTGVSMSSEALKASKLMYWFDDATAVQYVDIAGGVQLLDASPLTEGLHTLHYQVLCTNGQMTPAMSSIFLRLNADAETAVAKSLRYWFDEDKTAKEVKIVKGVQLLDASGLVEGLHSVHYQIVDSKGSLGAPASSIFLKMDWDTSTTTAKSLRYWFDDEETVVTVTVANGSQTLDASKLLDGLHTVHYQIVDDKGTLGAPASSVFLKMEASASSVAKSLRYWFDDDAATVSTTSVAGGTQTLDVSGLQTGLHTLNYQLIDSQGKVTAPVTRLFMKNFDKVITDGENRIVKYQYWLNTNSKAMQTVEVDKASNPYKLIALLPMQKEPIHSDCFLFEMTSGVPTMYAKNIIHTRFYDAQGYFTDGDKPFVDYSVKQEVTGAEWLESGVRATTNKPSENVVKWYQLSAEKGDSLSFVLDRAASMQLFSPSGKEVFSASGSESMGWGGCHAEEDGTFYLALHDVTATQGTTISIDYEHIDKYAVLRQDVSVVGNGGCSTITFEGNGFRDLYAVELTDGMGNTIEHVYIGHESDATTSVVFDFTNAVIGNYNALFHFAGEDKSLKNLVTIEEAKDIKLETTVTYSTNYLVGNGKTSYYANIKNSGNMTAYRTPVYIYLSCNNPNGVKKINVNGLNLPKLFDGIERDDLTEDDKLWLSELAEKIGETHYFIKTTKWDESISDSVYVWSAYFYTDIAPESTKTLIIDVVTTESVKVWVTVPKEYVPLIGPSESEFADARGVNRKVSFEELREQLCCQRSKIECLANIVADAVSIINLISDLVPTCPIKPISATAECIVGIVNQTVKGCGMVFCDDNSVEMNFWDKVEAVLSGISIFETLTKCASEYLPTGFFKDLMKVLSDGNNLTKGVDAFGIGVDVGDCIKAFTEEIPGCPPNPGGGGGTSTPVNSLDPNDIYGYRAESGSKAVKDGQTDVYYTVEFENDPQFATAAAHEIVVADTLDATKFDLSTYAPARIRIGSKSAELSGDKNFVTTVDMRPEINAIAQVEGTYDEKKGIARWKITSLDPMTMEPTKYVMDGVLPVNINGNGIGEASYNIKLRTGLTHGTKVSNRAGIVFDSNDVIVTPYWTNIMDRIAPESHVSKVVMATDSTAAVSIAATDELSGPWRYNVYVQYGDGAWFLGAENVPIDSVARVKVYEGIDHGFYTVVTDSAGNVEQKTAAREFTLEVFGSQVDTSTKLQLAEGWNWMSQNQQKALSVEAVKPKARRILSQTEELFNDSRLGWSGDLEELQPTEMYKVQMDEAAQVQLSGLLFNAAFRSIPLREGWNWMGYPVAKTMTPTEALAKLEAEEGDAIIGQDGMAQYSDGKWTGTLTEMQPGQGYMYRSVSDKNVFLNATAQSSSRRAQSAVAGVRRSMPEGWTVDKRRYPNVMGAVIQLCQDGVAVDAGEWLVGAFCGDECRGVAQMVDDVLMMNIYGQGGELLTFRVVHRESGELVGISEQETFRADLLGSIHQPYELNMGQLTGIVENEEMRNGGNEKWMYDLQGRKVKPQTAKGVYIVTDGNKSRTQKVVKK